MGKQEINQETMQRLALIRHLYQMGVSQSELPSPLSALSILMFHDAVELFLCLALERVDPALEPKLENKRGFMSYWEKLGSTTEDGSLPYRRAMDKLNDTRVALKHHGVVPSLEEVRLARRRTLGFFDACTPRLFIIDFDEISMLTFVRCAGGRMLLEQAEPLIQGDDAARRDAIVKIAEAFAVIIDDYTERKESPVGWSLFSFGPQLSEEGYATYGVDPDNLVPGWEQLPELLDNIAFKFEAMEGALMIVALGLDYRKYVRFRQATPRVRKGGDKRFYPRRDDRNDPPTAETCRFCFDFVVESAISLGSFDYDVSKSGLYYGSGDKVLPPDDNDFVIGEP